MAAASDAQGCYQGLDAGQGTLATRGTEAPRFHFHLSVPLAAEGVGPPVRIALVAPVEVFDQFRQQIQFLK